MEQQEDDCETHDCLKGLQQIIEIKESPTPEKDLIKVPTSSKYLITGGS